MKLVIIQAVASVLIRERISHEVFQTTFMNKEKSNILIIGTLASGSSALVDMLREYENINVLPREFDNFRRPGFVSDQLSYNTSIDYPNVIDNEIRFDSKKWKLIYKSSVWKLFFKDYSENILEKEWGKLKKYKDGLIELRHILSVDGTKQEFEI